MKQFLYRFYDHFPLILIITLSLLILRKSYLLYFHSDVYALAASIQDDSFYYMIPAFNFSNGNGFTFGGEKAYGFQVGYELLLVIVAAFYSSLSDLLRASLFLNAALFVCTGVFLYFTVTVAVAGISDTIESRNLARAGGLISTIVYSSNYWNFFNSTTGKENAFAALLLAVAIYIAMSRSVARNKKTNTVISGLVCGLLFITRPTPSTLLFMAVFILVNRDSLRWFLISLVVLPIVWAGFAAIYFGEIVPFSILVKASAPPTHLRSGLLYTAWEYFLTAIQFGIFGPSKVMLPQPNWPDALRANGLRVILYVGLCVSSTSFLFYFSKARDDLRRKAQIIITILLASAVGACIMGLSMAIKRPLETYYASWYFYDSPVVFSLLLGVGFFSLLKQGANNSTTLLKISFPIICLAMAVVCYHAAVRYTGLPVYSRDDFNKGVSEQRWQNTMMASGLWLLNHERDLGKKKVAAYSAGALGFVLNDRVVNLDGLANNNVAIRIISGVPVSSYLAQTKPDFYIDIVNSHPTANNVSLERLHVLPFSAYGGYQISRFVYENKN